MGVITVSKQFASGGVELAEQLAKELGYQLVGRRVLTELAKTLDMSEAQVELLKRGPEARWISLVDNYLIHTVRRIAQQPEAALNDKQYFAAVQELVKRLASEGNVVILGWGAQLILGQGPEIRHFRVVCPLEQRGERYAQRARIPLDQAQDECRRQDELSAGYVSHYLKRDWAEAELYHLTLNLGLLNFDFARAIRAIQATL